MRCSRETEPLLKFHGPAVVGAGFTDDALHAAAALASPDWPEWIYLGSPAGQVRIVTLDSPRSAGRGLGDLARPMAAIQIKTSFTWQFMSLYFTTARR